MGYFKRKLNRRRAGAEAAGYERELVEHGAWERLETGTELPGPARFLRFRIAVPNPDTPHLLGIFSGISEAEDLPDVPEAITDWIERESEWFANHLPYPYLDREDCVFFFKSDAREILRHVWSLAAALREAGVHVELQVVDHPGKLVYEDDCQVASLPWERI